MSDKQPDKPKAATKSLMSEETTQSIIFYVHGAIVTMSPGIFYVHGAVTRKPPGGTSVVSVERDEHTGKITLRIDKKKTSKTETS